MPGPRLNVNERSLYTRKMIAEKNANRLVYVCWFVCMRVWADVSARDLNMFILFGQFFLLNDQSVVLL